MKFHIYCCLIISLAYFAKADDGLCGIEPPKEGESCSGGGSDKKETDKNLEPNVFKYEYVEKPLTEEEKKKSYPKMRYTNKIDWPIREQLDLAEETLGSDYQKAIDMFDKILEQHPKSPRAFYLKTRSIENKLVNETKADYLLDKDVDMLLENYVKIMKRYQHVDDYTDELEVDWDVMPVMFYSVFHHSTTLASSYNKTEKCIEIYELAFELEPDTLESERYQILLITDLFIVGDFVKMEKVIDRALAKFEHSIMLQFFKGLNLKLTDKKKEGNKLLRNIDAEATDTSRFGHELTQLGNALFNTGKEHVARLVYQEASRLHVFLSQYQRPTLIIPGSEYESQPIWTVEDNVGLTRYDEEFGDFEAAWPKIKAEALALAKSFNSQDGNDDWSWWVMKQLKSLSNNLIVTNNGGALSAFPIFMYGKVKPTNCKEKAPVTCNFFRKSFPTAARFKWGVVKIMVLDPKTRTYPHEGVTNAKLRVIVPVQVPKSGFSFRIGKNDEVPFVEGKLSIFDDTYEHFYINDSDEKVVWLSFDIPHPDLDPRDSSKLKLTDFAKAFFMVR